MPTSSRPRLRRMFTALHDYLEMCDLPQFEAIIVTLVTFGGGILTIAILALLAQICPDVHGTTRELPSGAHPQFGSQSPFGAQLPYGATAQYGSNTQLNPAVAAGYYRQAQAPYWQASSAAYPVRRFGRPRQLSGTYYAGYPGYNGYLGANSQANQSAKPY